MRRGHRRDRHRHGIDAHVLLEPLPPAGGRRHNGDGQPQPEGVQRPQARLRQGDDMGRRDTANPQNHRGGRIRRRAARRDALARRHQRGVPRHARLENHARAEKAEGRLRLRQRRGRPLRARVPAPHRLRGDRALQRAGRQFPEPPPRPDEAREPSEAHRDGARTASRTAISRTTTPTRRSARTFRSSSRRCAQRARISASASTATPTG